MARVAVRVWDCGWDDGQVRYGEAPPPPQPIPMGPTLASTRERTQLGRCVILSLIFQNSMMTLLIFDLVNICFYFSFVISFYSTNGFVDIHIYRIDFENRNITVFVDDYDDRITIVLSLPSSRLFTLLRVMLAPGPARPVFGVH